ncbi:MAG: PQQ-binding-like beta-propeller repeat protein [Acidobacteriia bacterium]|nr:PQQ-binding-like beta-propeller repeat protein [Terriglobia bacterium]
MRRIFLVTAREYRRMVSLPGFWIVSLIVPVMVILAPFASSLGKSKTAGYILVDKSGQYAASIDRRLELDYQRQVLFQVLMYRRDWRAGGSSEPDTQFSPQRGTASSDAMVESFIAEGGAPAVLRQLKPSLLRAAPSFEPPIRPLVEIPIPGNVDASDPDRFGASVGPCFQESVKTDAGSVVLAVAVYIPQNVDSGGQVRIWSSGAEGASLIQDVKLELTNALRLKALRGAGIDPLSAARIGSLNPPVLVAAPEAPAPGSRAQIHSRLPQVMAFLLLISMMITGSMMLQGLVEERSNKLLEAVLACVSPRDLMIGKLAGISAIGLSIVGIWVSAAVVIIRIYPSSPLGFLLPALASLGETPWIAAMTFFYFLVGFLTIGMIFLAVGVTRESMQEAQAYLMPIAMVIAVPTALVTSMIFREPGGLIPRIFSWIPIYTPVVMLGRLESGVSSPELAGTAAILLAFGTLELFVLGRLFETNLIQTGHDFALRGFRFKANIRRPFVYAIAIILVAGVIIVRHRLKTPAKTVSQPAVSSSHGEALFRKACAPCHEPAVGRAPGRRQLASFVPADVVKSLTSGTMKPMAAGMSAADINAIATFLTGREPSLSSGAASPDPPVCPNASAFRTAVGDWSGWSIDPDNSRFQPDPGLTAAEIPRLKVKWSFNYPGGNYGQPTVAGGRLFVTSRSGAIYSLDARTGCRYWRFAQSVPSRTTISVGALPKIAPSGYAAYFGDTRANLYAVDAADGALLWKTQVDSHPRAMLTGSPVLFKGRLYVPVSSSEEGVASLASYSCCTFRGSVVALDAATGKVIWKAFAIERAPVPAGRNSPGITMYGPAGAAVWSAPTIDAKHSRLYFATGNSYTDVQEQGSDTIVAVDLESGRVLWRSQVTKSDNDLSGCTGGAQLVNCPKTHGHDYDFGSSPILLPLSNGRDILVAGQKSGVVYGIDPASGAILWRTQVGVGGFLGGIQWGMAADGRKVYVANSDVITSENGRPGLFALDPTTGKDIWYLASPKVACSWTSGAPCFNVQSAAPFAIPGVIFAGTTDGHERAYAAADGRILWDFDTAHGAIEVSSGSVANGMLYLISGYRGILGGGSDDVLLAFSVDGR